MAKRNRALKYNEMVENEINKLNYERELYIKEYKKRRISVSLIAERIGVSRKTLYNNDVLHLVEQMRIQQEKEDIIFINLRLSEEIERLKDMLDKLIKRDFELLLYKGRTKELEAIIKEKDVQIKTINQIIRSQRKR